MAVSNELGNKRPAILEAALALFAERGIHAATTREIASRAGITEGAIYRHFASKEALAQGLFVDCVRRLVGAMEVAVAGESAGAGSRAAGEQLESACRAFWGFAHTDPEAFDYIMASHHDALPSMPPGETKPKDVFERIVEAGIEAGEFRAIDATLVTAFIVGMMIRTVVFGRAGMLDLDTQTVTDGICDAVRRIVVP